MPFFLRLLGITNAAVWFGSAVFLVAAAWPAFASSEMQRLLPPSHSGAAAQIVFGHYLILQTCCGALAVAHYVLEGLYSSRPWRRRTISLVAGLIGLGLFNGLVAGPTVKRLNLDLYGVRSTPSQREQAHRTFGLWQDVLKVSNFLIVLGLWGYVWEINQTDNTPRFVGAAKFRG